MELTIPGYPAMLPSLRPQFDTESTRQGHQLTDGNSEMTFVKMYIDVAQGHNHLLCYIFSYCTEHVHIHVKKSFSFNIQIK